MDPGEMFDPTVVVNFRNPNTMELFAPEPNEDYVAAETHVTVNDDRTRVTVTYTMCRSDPDER
jgi:hypothetical protein